MWNAVIATTSDLTQSRVDFISRDRFYGYPGQEDGKQTLKMLGQFREASTIIQ